MLTRASLTLKAEDIGTVSEPCYEKSFSVEPTLRNMRGRGPGGGEHAAVYLKNFLDGELQCHAKHDEHEIQ